MQEPLLARPCWHWRSPGSGAPGFSPCRGLSHQRIIRPVVMHITYLIPSLTRAPLALWGHELIALETG